MTEESEVESGGARREERADAAWRAVVDGAGLLYGWLQCAGVLQPMRLGGVTPFLQVSSGRR